MSVIRQGTTYNRTFIIVESGDHISPLLGASPTVQLSKNAGAFVNASGVVSEIGNGWYNVALTSLDTNTPGELAYHVTAAGGDDSDFADQIISAAPSPTPPTPPTPVPGKQPNLYGFILFIQNVMGIPASILPTDSPVISMALAVAMTIVNPALKCVPVTQYDAAGLALNSGQLTVYALAVYNLAGSNLLQYAQDQPGAPNVPKSDPPMPFFEFTRKKWNLLGFVSGVISGSSDEGTSQTLVVQEAAKAFTIANLQQLKDPYGRQYLALAQSWGPVPAGIS